MKRAAGTSALTKTRSRPRAVVAPPLLCLVFTAGSLPEHIPHEFVGAPDDHGYASSRSRSETGGAVPSKACIGGA